MQEELRFVHGGNVYEPTADGEPWLDFSANINPLGLSPRVKEALAAHLDGVIHYPDPAMRELRTALSAYYGRAPGDFILGNGAAELFYLYAFVTRPKRVLLPVPAFSEYERAAHAAGAAVSYSPLEEREDFEPDL
ncbi:MAG: aminotransferase class I/II-fold pyridoxal phosphate-dependent enzyme, partial [Mitsuokella jalaludinii]|nr:aminotransferase class I/II-fold pyridoxal phosphate-dependent enzyme [Mitsuokella jalaludinii]